jgi:hypothetical protein
MIFSDSRGRRIQEEDLQLDAGLEQKEKERSQMSISAMI